MARNKYVQPTDVPCPYCGRNYGEWCHDWRGKALDGKPHAYRCNVANRVRAMIKFSMRWAAMDEFQIFMKGG